MSNGNPFISGDGCYNLALFWDWLYSLSEKIHEQKDGFKSTRAWNKKSHFIGNCGEFTITLATGLAFDHSLRINGQGNKADFDSQDVEVKCSTFWSDPHLKHPVTEKRWPTYFVLVALDESKKRSKIVGWATSDELKAGTVANYGYGEQFTLPPKKLHPGLPPGFVPKERCE